MTDILRDDNKVITYASVDRRVDKETQRNAICCLPRKPCYKYAATARQYHKIPRLHHRDTMEKMTLNEIA